MVVLGQTGRNFAAGMSGGVAYVFDPEGDFASRCDTSMVTLSAVLPEAEQRASIDPAIWHRARPGLPAQTDEEILKTLVQAHFRHTGSFRARDILADWETMRGRFVKVVSPEYQRALADIAARRQAELPPGEAERSAEAESVGTVAAVADGQHAAPKAGKTRQARGGSSAGKVPAARRSDDI